MVLEITKYGVLRFGTYTELIISYFWPGWNSYVRQGVPGTNFSTKEATLLFRLKFDPVFSVRKMKIRGSVVSSSFIFPHPPEDEKTGGKKKEATLLFSDYFRLKLEPETAKYLSTNCRVLLYLTGAFVACNVFHVEDDQVGWMG